MLNFRIEGKGRPVLMIHGYGIAFPIWQNLAPLLTPHLQLIEIELPGIGTSSLPDTGISYGLACARELTRLRETLGIEKWDVFSYSAGTSIAKNYIRLDQQHIRHAIFLCPVTNSGLLITVLRLLIALDRYWAVPGTWLLTGSRMAMLVRILAFNGHAHPYADLWTREIHSQRLEIMKATLREIISFEARSLKQLPLPVKIIWGREDILAPPPSRAGANDVIIPGDHSISMRSVESIAPIVLEFLNNEETG
jgi:pimeloyl-ACP methyl ester carboxylesterase